MLGWSFSEQVRGIVKGDGSPRQTESGTQRRRSARPPLKCLVFGLVRDRSVPEGRAPLVTPAESNGPPKYITCPVYNETRNASRDRLYEAFPPRKHLRMKQTHPPRALHPATWTANYAHSRRTLADREMYLPIDAADRFRAIDWHYRT